MKNKYLRIPLFLMVLLVFSMTHGQESGSPWIKITKNSVSQNKMVSQNYTPVKAQYYQLDMTILKAKLQSVPQRDSEK